MALEGITINGESLRDIITEENVKEDEMSVKCKRKRLCISTRHPYFKKENTVKEVKIIMAKGKNVTTIDNVVRLVNEACKNGESFTRKEIADKLGSSQSLVNNCLLFLTTRFGINRSRTDAKSPFIYLAKKPIPQAAATMAWTEWTSKQERKHPKAQAANDNEDDAILLHATCELTKVPWHSETAKVKDLFREITNVTDPKTMLKLAFAIALAALGTTQGE